MTWLHHHPGRPVARLPVFQRDLGHKNPQRLYINVVSFNQLQPWWSQAWKVSGVNMETLHDDVLSYCHTIPMFNIYNSWKVPFTNRKGNLSSTMAFRGFSLVKLWCIHDCNILNLWDCLSVVNSTDLRKKRLTSSRECQENSGRFRLNWWTFLNHISI